MARYSFQRLVMVEINKTEIKLSNDHLIENIQIINLETNKRCSWINHDLIPDPPFSTTATEPLKVPFQEQKFLTDQTSRRRDSSRSHVYLLPHTQTEVLNVIRCSFERHLTFCRFKLDVKAPLLLPQSANDPQDHFPFPELINRVEKGVGRGGGGELGPLCEAERVNEWGRGLLEWEDRVSL